MSSDVIKNTNIDSLNKDKNKSINTFSKNFNKCFNKIKYSKKSNDNNNTESSNNINNLKNNIITKNNNTQSNTLMEFEFIYNDSINKNTNSKLNTKLNKEKDIKNKTSNNNSEKKYKNDIKYNNTYNLPVDDKKKYSYKKPMNKALSAKSPLYQNKNKYKNGRPTGEKKLKRNLSQKNHLEIFLQSVKDHQIKKETNINNIRNKTLEKENSEIKNHPEISEGSLMLLKNIKREPLYQKIPLNEEKNLDKNFKSFYSKNIDDKIDKINNTHLIKSPLNSKTIDEKFSKFYENNLKWKKTIEERNDNKRNNKKEFEDIIGNCSFKPKLNKNSINIIDKKNRNKTIDYEINNNLYDHENEKELIEKLKIKLKPILNEHYNKNKSFISKKSALLIRTLSDNNMRNNMYHNYNYKKKQNVNNKNIKINYKTREKKYKNKKEEKKDEKEKKINLNKKGKDYYLLLKIRQLQKEKADKKKELYKLNIRQGTAWNLEAINSVVPRHQCGHIIEGLL